jgi:hypothetical protein
MSSGPNWARHYRTGPRRLCARPGCGSTAAATLRFLPTQREAWLVDLDQSSARTEGDLCARHAAGLVLPRGWNLHDERTRPNLVAVPTRKPAAPPRKPKRPAKRVQPRVSPEPEPEPELPLEPATNTATEELAAVLDARTPLLRRAFSNVWPIEGDT